MSETVKRAEDVKPHYGLYDPVPVGDKVPEVVDHPAYYRPGTFEAINVIEAWGLGFCLGNAVKYICRAGHKGVPVEDLKKARWYIDREIANRERE